MAKQLERAVLNTPPFTTGCSFLLGSIRDQTGTTNHVSQL